MHSFWIWFQKNEDKIKKKFYSATLGNDLLSFSQILNDIQKHLPNSVKVTIGLKNPKLELVLRNDNPTWKDIIYINRLVKNAPEFQYFTVHAFTPANPISEEDKNYSSAYCSDNGVGEINFGDIFYKIIGYSESIYNTKAAEIEFIFSKYPKHVALDPNLFISEMLIRYLDTILGELVCLTKIKFGYRLKNEKDIDYKPFWQISQEPFFKNIPELN